MALQDIVFMSISICFNDKCVSKSNAVSEKRQLVLFIFYQVPIFFFYSTQSCRPCRWTTLGQNKNIPLIYAPSLHSRTDLLFYELGHGEEEHYTFKAMCLLEDCENCSSGFWISFFLFSLVLLPKAFCGQFHCNKN